MNKGAEEQEKFEKNKMQEKQRQYAQALIKEIDNKKLLKEH